jgi:hypothetical protein
MTNKTIAIVSSYTTDRLLNGDTGEIIKDQRGGPALYAAAALERLGITPHVYTHSEILVKMRVYEDEEFGSAEYPHTPKPFPNVTEDAAIFSTILKEWSLDGAHDYKGRIFMDVQGYVRDGSDFGKKIMWEAADQYMDAVFCMRGNAFEMQYIPQKVLDDQKAKRMLITTYDKKGAIIFYKGKETKIVPKTIVSPPNSIGAGDTFLSSFLAKFLKTEDVELSGTFAADRTSEFLATIQ